MDPMAKVIIDPRDYSPEDWQGVTTWRKIRRADADNYPYRRTDRNDPAR
jgi:hypothetical protein